MYVHLAVYRMDLFFEMIGANELSGKAREQEFFAKDKDTASVIDNHERLADMYKKTVDDIEKLLRSL